MPRTSGRAVDHPRGQQRLDLRAPEQPAVDLGVVERADADPVAAQDQGPVVAVPERDGELARGPSRTSPRRGPRRGGPRPRCRSGSPGVWPRARSSWRSSGYSKSSPLKATQIERSSLAIGCRPPARSMIESRRAPRATPGSMWTCSSSGPRWAIAPVIASSRASGNSGCPSGRPRRRCRTCQDLEMPDGESRRPRAPHTAQDPRPGTV